MKEQSSFRVSTCPDAACFLIGNAFRVRSRRAYLEFADADISFRSALTAPAFLELSASDRR